MNESPYAVAHDFALMVPAPDGVDDAIGGDRAHGHHEFAAQTAGRFAGDPRSVHRDVASLGDVSNGDALVLERPLEREAAAEQECDEVVAPVLSHVGHLRDQLTVAKDPVEGHVGADVAVHRVHRAP